MIFQKYLENTNIALKFFLTYQKSLVYPNCNTFHPFIKGVVMVRKSFSDVRVLALITPMTTNQSGFFPPTFLFNLKHSGQSA